MQVEIKKTPKSKYQVWKDNVLIGIADAEEMARKIAKIRGKREEERNDQLRGI